MVNQPIQSQPTYKEDLEQALQQAGFSLEEITRASGYLDEQFTNEISQDVVNELSEEKKIAYDALIAQEASADELLAFLNVTEEDFIKRYGEKLHAYIQNLPEHISMLKEQITNPAA